MRNMAAAALMIFVLFISGAYLYAVQPVDVIRKNPSAFFVRQGAGQCGPASFYIVFRYHGDDRRAYMFSKGADGRLFSMGIDSLPRDENAGGINNRPVIIKKDSPVSQWMNGRDNSTGWGELTTAINNLYYVNDRNNRERFYSVIESNDRATEPGQKHLQARQREFFNRIVPLFLNSNRPVIVHLKRKWPYPGHYIVLVGYDPALAAVFYMNPNDADSDMVRSVPADRFLNSYWYEANPELRWGRACWNGQWIGFYRQ